MAMSSGVDLSNCDREPIHIPGSIQPHGALIACDAEVATVLRCSQNAGSWLELAAQPATGQKLEALLGRDVVHELRNTLAQSSGPASPGLILGLQIGTSAKAFDVSIHEYNGAAIIEFEEAAAGGTNSALAIARGSIARLGKTSQANALATSAARLLKGILDYDRVMIYRFAEDGAGQVIAEAKRGDLEPFLGLHYPASDIPQQARELYIKNKIRIIANIDGERVAIVPELDASGTPLDLSFAHLRSVSPIHCEYLRNMGVSASMSISIVVGGELWGLVACHHYSPKKLSMSERVAAEMIGQFLSLHLEALEQREKLDVATQARRVLDELLSHLSQQPDVIQALRANIATIARMLPCDGVGLWLDDIWTGHGSTPPADAIAALADHVSNVASDSLWASDCISDSLPLAVDYRAEASGVFAIALSQTPRDYLFFFRKEVIQTVEWAGNPEKVYATGPLGDRLTPRKSFAIWKETVERCSTPWSERDREMALAIRNTLLEVVIRHNEILAEEREKADLRHKVLNQELNHRVKNILALISALVSQPAERGVDNYVASLRGRIEALAHAHDQVIRGGGALRELLEVELSPYRGTTALISLEGPSVGLDARGFSVMALVIHELSTNAAKYGALSVPSGQLHVRWDCAPEGCEVVWSESGGPDVVKPSHSGFGSKLLERIVPFDLGGESKIEYSPTGVRARFFVPARFVSRIDDVPQKAPAPAQETGEESAAFLRDLKVLVVEDQFVIAIDVEQMLMEKGAVVETAASATEALRKLSRFGADVAILDVNLGSETSLPVAEELLRRQVPFIFATGYGDSGMVPETMHLVPMLRKPYEGKALARMLGRALSR